MALHARTLGYVSVALVVFALVALLVPTSPAHHRRPTDSSTCYDHVPKTSRGGTIFFSMLGMEHTGHAYWGHLARAVTNGSSTPTSRHVIRDMTLRHQSGCQSTLEAVETLATALRDDASTRENESHVHLGMCSWPCGGPVRSPDVHMVASAAETAGVDYRALVLLRHPTALFVFD